VLEVYDISKLQADGAASTGGLQLEGVSPSLWSAIFRSQKLPGKGRATASSAVQGYTVAEGASGQGQQQELQALAAGLADQLQLGSLGSESGSDGYLSGGASSSGDTSSGGGTWRRQSPAASAAARLRAQQCMRRLLQAEVQGQPQDCGCAASSAAAVAR
jgi:hypothetical protein